MGAAPITLRCAVCKKGRDYDGSLNDGISERRSAENLYRTGREKTVGTYGRRHHVKLVEVVHEPAFTHGCHNKGWSAHIDATRKPLWPGFRE